MMRAGLLCRSAPTAARIVDPVANPSSTTMMVRPANCGKRARCRGRSSAGAPSPAIRLSATDSTAAGEIPKASITSMIEDAQAPACNRTHRQFAMTGHSQLAHHEHVQRRVQRARYFIGNGHASPWQAQHQDPGIAERNPRVFRPAACPASRRSQKSAPPYLRPCATERTIIAHRQVQLTIGERVS